MHTMLENLGHWALTKGLHIVLVVLFTVLTTRIIRWIAARISRRLNRGGDHHGTLRSETVKHGQAVASVISSLGLRDVERGCRNRRGLQKSRSGGGQRDQAARISAPVGPRAKTLTRLW